MGPFGLDELKGLLRGRGVGGSGGSGAGKREIVDFNAV
jgi:hypothetical protein